MSEIQKKSISEDLKNLRFSITESAFIKGGASSTCRTDCTLCITKGEASCISCIACISKAFDKDGVDYNDGGEAN